MLFDISRLGRSTFKIYGILLLALIIVIILLIKL